MQHGTQTSNVTRSRLRQGFFGRMFWNLPPYEPVKGNEEKSLIKLEELAENMHETTAESKLPGGDNNTIPAGYTYFGQFVDHDITFDPISSLDRFNDPDRLTNFRTPCFDLDCIYGRGPKDNPFLYDDEDNQLLTGCNSIGEDDLLRNDPKNEKKAKRAIIGDPRNDENTNVSQMQLAMIKFHNKVITSLPKRTKLSDRINEARRLVTWHYQYVVIHDFVRRLVGDEILQSKLPERKGSKEIRLDFYDWKNAAFMPVEFSVAAYRLGHTMVRSSYNLNKTSKNIPIFTRNRRAKNLRGFRELPKNHGIHWNHFLDFDTKDIQFSRKLDIKLAPELQHIPTGKNKTESLAFLNLKRAYRMGLPSGQTVAKTMGIEALQNIGGIRGEDPLWFYILKEAELLSSGEKLGPVGANIVAEVFIGILAHDPNSYLSIDPTWTPDKEKFIEKMGERFELRDIIKFSGMPIS